MCDNYKKFDKMMKNKRKLAKFEAFLESEFSPENLEFYKRVTKFKKSKNLEEDAKQIYINFIGQNSGKPVSSFSDKKNLDVRKFYLSDQH